MDDSSVIQFSQATKSANVVREKGFNFDDARIMRGAWRNEPNPDMCKVVEFNDKIWLSLPFCYDMVEFPIILMTHLTCRAWFMQ